MPYLIEETYELVDALEALDADDPATDEALIEELGDLLYQIEFHATIAEQEGRFSIADVAEGIHDKLVRRHPHVFGDGRRRRRRRRCVRQLGRDQARREGSHVRVRRHRHVAAVAVVRRPGAEEGGQGRLRLARRRRRAAEDRRGGRRAPCTPIASGDGRRIADELGDLLFAVVNVARHLDVEPSSRCAPRPQVPPPLRRGRGCSPPSAASTSRGADLAALDALWDEVKLAE